MNESATQPAASGVRLWLQPVLLGIVAFAILSPSLGAGFIWDDVQQIVNSPTISDPEALRRYFSLNVVSSWGSEGRGAEGVDTYRPLFFIALWLIHRINGPDPFWFHLAVLAAHLGVCLLLWVLTRRWVGSSLAAAAVFLTFAVHPVTSEAYLWASAISEPMAVAGLLGAVLILDLWCRTARAAWPAVTAAALTMLIGLLAKESVATALPVLSIYLCRVRQVRARALLGPWLAVGVFLALRVSALSGLQASGSGTGQRVEALRNLPVLIVDGLRALITLEPVGIRHLYWDYRDVGWAMSLVAAVTVALLAAIAWASRRRMPLIPTALGVMICMMAPIALIATVPGWGGYGRYLYLPLAFGLLATAEWGRWLQTSLATHVPKFLPVLPVVVIVFFCFELVGLRQAFDTYRSQESLARASTELQPHAPDGWEWLGNHYLEVGDLDNAVRCYANAVAIEPSIYRPRHNLAAALLYLGRPAEALEHETAIESIHGITAQGAFVAARACLDLGRWREAGRWLERGLEHEPDNRRLLELRARWEAGRPGADSSPPPG